MAQVTALTIINAAGRKLGLSLTSAQQTNALEALNNFISYCKIDGLGIGISELSGTGSTVELTDEYKLFLIYNLAVLIAPEHDVVLDSLVVEIAERSRQVIMSDNTTVSAKDIPYGLLYNQYNADINSGE